MPPEPAAIPVVSLPVSAPAGSEVLSRAAPAGPGGDPLLRVLAICLHGISPRTYAAVRRLRQWLGERGVDQVTLAVIPAADRHPLATRSPEFVSWLRHRLALGDSVAQSGLVPRGRAEFAGLGEAETRERVLIGRALLEEVELDPRGFVAGQYAYTPALRRVLAEHFDWFAERRQVWTPTQIVRVRARRLGRSARALRRDESPALWRVDLHPGDLDRASGRSELERLLRGVATRTALTYEGAISAQFADIPAP